MQGYQINSEHFSEAIVYSLELESVAQHNQDRINSVLMGMNPPSDLDINSYIYRLKALVSNLTNEASIIKNSTLGILESVNRTEAELGSDINAYFWEDLIMWLVVNNKSIDDSIFNYLSPEVREQVKKQMLNYLYNGTTHYGGDQIGPLKGYTNGDTMYAQIIRKYFPKMTEEEVLDYLQSINNVGCGYVAIANYVFEGYIDKPEQFQNKFGFPMFYTDEDGNIVSSINYLVTDIYCNSNKKGLSFNFLVPEEPTQIGTINGYYSGYRGDSRNANGLNKFNEKEILSDERYKEANINKKVLKPFTASLPFDIPYFSQDFNDYSEKIKSSLKKGNVISLDASDYTLYPADINNHKIPNIEPEVIKNGPHAMTITDVNEDGEFVISSWGERYILDSDSIDNYFGLGEISFN